MFSKLKSALQPVVTAALFVILSLPCIAEDELDNAEEQANSSFWIQVVGIAVVVIVVVILLIVNRAKIFGSRTHGGASQPLDEDKVSDTVRISDPDFKRDDFKAYAGKTIINILEGITKKSVSAIRPYESDNQYSEHAKLIREFIESGHTNHYDDLKPVSAELAEFVSKDGFDRITVRAAVQMLDYISDDASGDVLEGSKLAKRTRAYKMTFIRKSGVKSGEKSYVSDTCPCCGKPLNVTASGKCAECKAELCVGNYTWMLDAMTKWGHES